jgi:chemotaxis protein MotA
LTTIGGLLFVMICVFGSYLLSGGSIEPLVEALPFEFMTIGGAAVGTFVMSNSMHDVKHTLHGIGKVIKGSAYKKQDYLDLLCLLYYFVRLASTKGTMALEPHIEKPSESPAFAKFPGLQSNHHLSDTICDYLRLVGMNADDPNQIEDIMGRELKKSLNEELHSAHAIQSVADSLPALGIVAAVLGVIKTMSHINEPPAVLGAMIGGALVGTFLGILLSYGIAAPIANRLKSVVEEEGKFIDVVRAVIVAHLNGNAPVVSVESGRKMAPSQFMPSFQELEAATQALQI